LNRLSFGFLGKQSGGKKNFDFAESLKKMNELKNIKYIHD
jgi:hypothetical protein